MFYIDLKKSTDFINEIVKVNILKILKRVLLMKWVGPK